ncbi:50S ribosomal protein L13 [Candidatus Karelsulcia muelleri]|uniref:50S ribosomal protein L13 n=1 Tax=Candidatus Karelsulcia muelleri TaxID=336810 RepID=UPI001FF6E9B6|nr:50S ribosomal protein L13 [Candidatus Karelsulcia muelleri]UOQ32938.1 50S ribosomal protein L13 [Candidatus Karelsulcia muelleri]
MKKKINWYIFNAFNKTLGRLASVIACIIIGKHQINFSPQSCGDKVIIINAKHILLGSKTNNKTYISYSGYPGGKKVKKVSELIKKRPEFIIRKAVLGMLPKNSFKKKIKNLYIFPNNRHNIKNVSNVKYFS